MELTLQFKVHFNDFNEFLGRNPYFIGINSAIEYLFSDYSEYDRRNPYFIGINSAIKQKYQEAFNEMQSQSLFYWN